MRQTSEEVNRFMHLSRMEAVITAACVSDTMARYNRHTIDAFVVRWKRETHCYTGMDNWFGHQL